MRRKPDRDVKLPVAFKNRCRNGAGERGLNHCCDIAGVQPVSCDFLAVDLDVEIGLAERMEDFQVGDAICCGKRLADAFGDVFQNIEVRADDFGGVAAVDAGNGGLNVIFDILREAEDNARQFVPRLALQLFRQVLFSETGRPFIERLQRREDLDIGESLRVTAVVRTAKLGNNRSDFRMPEQNLTDLPRILNAGLKRHCRRQGGADPVIAFFQRWEKLGSKTHAAEHTKANKDATHNESLTTVSQRPSQRRCINVAQPAHESRFNFLNLLRQHDRRQHRRHREGGEERARQGIGVGARHRTKDLSFDARHGEERQKGRDGDDRGK